MAGGLSLLGQFPLKSTRLEQYLFTCKFDTNDTSAPDGVDPSNAGFAVARTGVNQYTLTFDAMRKPKKLNFGACAILGDLPGISAKVVSYTESTGVLVIRLYDEDNTSGIEAATPESNNVTVQVQCWFSRYLQR